MKKQINSFIGAVLVSMALVSCGDTKDRNNTTDTARGEKDTEQADSTYMENADNNGQPTTDHDGGSVTETKGAPESGYGNANGSESTSPTGSAGNAAQRGESGSTDK
jgi:hypothetical protein